MAFEACATEIGTACQTLSISSGKQDAQLSGPKMLRDNSTDPFNWSVSDVQSWILWQIQQYQLPSSIRMEYFNMTGIDLCNLGEQDFKMRAPSQGETLYALLDIWRLACLVDSNPPDNHLNHQQPQHPGLDLLQLGKCCYVFHHHLLSISLLSTMVGMGMDWDEEERRGMKASEVDDDDGIMIE